MENFWKWMQEMGYAMSDNPYVNSLNNEAEDSYIRPIKQMLIGYMEEYLLVVGGVSVGNPSNIYIRLQSGERFANIRFAQLQDAINEVMRRKAVKDE